MELALTILILLFVVTVLPVLLIALSLRSMARSNRVSPKVPTFAPTSWLFLPERPARLHRRLRRSAGMARAGAAVHASGPGRGLHTVPDLAEEIERRACSVDTQVVMAARARGAARWSMLNSLEAEVDEIESLAGRLVAMTTTWATAAAAGQQQPGGTQAIAERLDALEQAMREVDALSSGHPGPDHPAWGPYATTPQPQPEPAPRLRKVQGGDERVI